LNVYGCKIKHNFSIFQTFSGNYANLKPSFNRYVVRLVADRYKDYPAKSDEMMKQYEGENMFPLTAVVGEDMRWN
jgi:hypothetical protein